METIGVVVQDAEGFTDPTYEQLMALVEQAGLRGYITTRPGRNGSLYSVNVGRDAVNHHDWSMPNTRIAIGPSIQDVSRKAITAIKTMAPQIQAKLDAASPEAAETDPREERIAVALERIAAALESMVADDD